MAGIGLIGSRIWSRRRSTKTETAGLFLKVDAGRNRSASDSAVHDKRHQRDRTDRIELTVEVRNIAPSKSFDSAEQVICILYEKDYDDDKKWRMHISSEPQRRVSGRIVFRTSFPLDYVFERTQLIKVEIREYSARSVLAGAVVGVAIFKLNELIGAFGARISKSLMSNPSVGSRTSDNSVSTSNFRGSVLIDGHLIEKAEPVILQFAGKNLEKRDKFFDETEVFFRMYRIQNDDERVLLYESEGIRNHSHPIWKPFSLQMKSIADNRNRLLEIIVFYRDEVDKSGIIGKFLTTYAKMKYGPGPENIYTVMNPKKQHKKGYSGSGKFEMVKFTDVTFYSFLDYITSGTQLHMAVAVDFSTSSFPVSPAQIAAFDSDFCLTLRAIGEIVRDYSPNRLFPSFGTGARVPPLFDDCEPFWLNFEGSDSYCRGLNAVIEAYRNTRQAAIPVDYASYSKVIFTVAKMASSVGEKGLHYYILLIFTTGGPINDIKEVQSALSFAQNAPISIIFVGIGAGDFSETVRLIESSRRLNYSSKQSERDTTEFLELNVLIDRTASSEKNKRRIAEQSLHCIPRHIVSYMHRHYIAAKPPIQISRSPLFHASYLIPDRPSEFNGNINSEAGSYWLKVSSGVPNRQRPISERAPLIRSDDYCCGRSGYHSGEIYDERGRNYSLSDERLMIRRETQRSRSEIHTTREQLRRRIQNRYIPVDQDDDDDDDDDEHYTPRLQRHRDDATKLRTHSCVRRTPSNCL